MYEQRIVTYPRTDSRFLTDDMAAGIPPLVAAVSGVLPFLKMSGVPIINVPQVINSAKVSDHHAIIPTPTMPKADLTALPTAERNILHMICTRLVSAVSERHTYAETVITVECDGETFTAKGKTVVKDGWKAIEQAFIRSTGKEKKDGDKPLPELYKGQTFTAKSSVREGFTQPPKHFTEDLLLSAMETAGADDMPEDAERKGLGTPATRAAIIENLVKSEFLTRKDKTLLPTEKSVNLVKILPPSVKSPMLTAEWENHLKRIERGDLSADDLMVSINKFVSDLVKTHTAPADEHKALFPSNRQSGEITGKCPRCQNNVTERPKGFFCENKGCKFGLFKDNKFFTSQKKTITKEIAAALLSEGRVFVSGFVSEKTKKPYNATVILDDKGEGYAGFKIEYGV
jgi:DNA topoisomerase-3